MHVEKRSGQASDSVRTLAIDIGGSGIKAIVLDASGKPLTTRSRVETPRPATPDAVLDAIVGLAKAQGEYDRVSVGFPGVVRNGVTETAPNLDTKWQGYHLADALTITLGRPARVANDADVQGFGAIAGHGVELVITLGTGFGSALFVDGRLVPNLELAHHPFRKSKTYEDYLGNPARQKVGKKRWNKRLAKAVRTLEMLFSYDRLYIGGGNTKYITHELPPNVTIVPNLAGLLGGIALWR
ncbi:MAG: ROK family protein [Nitrospiraceae bacterium]